MWKVTKFGLCHFRVCRKVGKRSECYGVGQPFSYPEREQAQRVADQLNASK